MQAPSPASAAGNTISRPGSPASRGSSITGSFHLLGDADLCSSPEPELMEPISPGSEGAAGDPAVIVHSHGHTILRPSTPGSGSDEGADHILSANLVSSPARAVPVAPVLAHAHHEPFAGASGATGASIPPHHPAAHGLLQGAGRQLAAVLAAAAHNPLRGLGHNHVLLGGVEEGADGAAPAPPPRTSLARLCARLIAGAEGEGGEEETEEAEAEEHPAAALAASAPAAFAADPGLASTAGHEGEHSPVEEDEEGEVPDLEDVVTPLAAGAGAVTADAASSAAEGACSQVPRDPLIASAIIRSSYPEEDGCEGAGPAPSGWLSRLTRSLMHAPPTAAAIAPATAPAPAATEGEAVVPTGAARAEEGAASAVSEAPAAPASAVAAAAGDVVAPEEAATAKAASARSSVDGGSRSWEQVADEEVQGAEAQHEEAISNLAAAAAAAAAADNDEARSEGGSSSLVEGEEGQEQDLAARLSALEEERDALAGRLLATDAALAAAEASRTALAAAYESSRALLAQVLSDGSSGASLDPLPPLPALTAKPTPPAAGSNASGYAAAALGDGKRGVQAAAAHAQQLLRRGEAAGSQALLTLAQMWQDPAHKQALMRGAQAALVAALLLGVLLLSPALAGIMLRARAPVAAPAAPVVQPATSVRSITAEGAAHFRQHDMQQAGGEQAATGGASDHTDKPTPALYQAMSRQQLQAKLRHEAAAGRRHSAHLPRHLKTPKQEADEQAAAAAAPGAAAKHILQPDPYMRVPAMLPSVAARQAQPAPVAAGAAREAGAVVKAAPAASSAADVVVQQEGACSWELAAHCTPQRSHESTDRATVCGGSQPTHKPSRPAAAAAKPATTKLAASGPVRTATATKSRHRCPAAFASPAPSNTKPPVPDSTRHPVRPAAGAVTPQAVPAGQASLTAMAAAAKKTQKGEASCGEACSALPALLAIALAPTHGERCAVAVPAVKPPSTAVVARGAAHACVSNSTVGPLCTSTGSCCDGALVHPSCGGVPGLYVDQCAWAPHGQRALMAVAIAASALPPACTHCLPEAAAEAAARQCSIPCLMPVPLERLQQQPGAQNKGAQRHSNLHMASAAAAHRNGSMPCYFHISRVSFWHVDAFAVAAVASNASGAASASKAWDPRRHVKGQPLRAHAAHGASPYTNYSARFNPLDRFLFHPKQLAALYCVHFQRAAQASLAAAWWRPLDAQAQTQRLESPHQGLRHLVSHNTNNTLAAVGPGAPWLRSDVLRVWQCSANGTNCAPAALQPAPTRHQAHWTAGIKGIGAPANHQAAAAPAPSPAAAREQQQRQRQAATTSLPDITLDLFDYEDVMEGSALLEQLVASGHGGADGAAWLLAHAHALSDHNTWLASRLQPLQRSVAAGRRRVAHVQARLASTQKERQAAVLAAADARRQLRRVLNQAPKTFRVNATVANLPHPRSAWAQQHSMYKDWACPAVAADAAAAAMEQEFDGLLSCEEAIPEPMPGSQQPDLASLMQAIQALAASARTRTQHLKTLRALQCNHRKTEGLARSARAVAAAERDAAGHMAQTAQQLSAYLLAHQRCRRSETASDDTVPAAPNHSSRGVAASHHRFSSPPVAALTPDIDPDHFDYDDVMSGSDAFILEEIPLMSYTTVDIYTEWSYTHSNYHWKQVRESAIIGRDLWLIDRATALFHAVHAALKKAAAAEARLALYQLRRDAAVTSAAAAKRQAHKMWAALSPAAVAAPGTNRKPVGHSSGQQQQQRVALVRSNIARAATACPTVNATEAAHILAYDSGPITDQYWFYYNSTEAGFQYYFSLLRKVVQYRTNRVRVLRALLCGARRRAEVARVSAEAAARERDLALHAAEVSYRLIVAAHQHHAKRQQLGAWFMPNVGAAAGSAKNAFVNASADAAPTPAPAAATTAAAAENDGPLFRIMKAAPSAPAISPIPKPLLLALPPLTPVGSPHLLPPPLTATVPTSCAAAGAAQLLALPPATSPEASYQAFVQRSLKAASWKRLLASLPPPLHTATSDSAAKAGPSLHSLPPAAAATAAVKAPRQAAATARPAHPAQHTPAVLGAPAAAVLVAHALHAAVADAWMAAMEARAAARNSDSAQTRKAAVSARVASKPPAAARATDSAVRAALVHTMKPNATKAEAAVFMAAAPAATIPLKQLEMREAVLPSPAAALATRNASACAAASPLVGAGSGSGKPACPMRAPGWPYERRPCLIITDDTHLSKRTLTKPAPSQQQAAAARVTPQRLPAAVPTPVHAALGGVAKQQAAAKPPAARHKTHKAPVMMAAAALPAAPSPVMLPAASTKRLSYAAAAASATSKLGRQAPAASTLDPIPALPDAIALAPSALALGPSVIAAAAAPISLGPAVIPLKAAAIPLAPAAIPLAASAAAGITSSAQSSAQRAAAAAAAAGSRMLALGVAKASALRKSTKPLASVAGALAAAPSRALTGLPSLVEMGVRVVDTRRHQQQRKQPLSNVTQAASRAAETALVVGLSRALMPLVAAAARTPQPSCAAKARPAAANATVSGNQAGKSKAARGARATDDYTSAAADGEDSGFGASGGQQHASCAKKQGSKRKDRGVRVYASSSSSSKAAEAASRSKRTGAGKGAEAGGKQQQQHESKGSSKEGSSSSAHHKQRHRDATSTPRSSNATRTNSTKHSRTSAAMQALAARLQQLAHSLRRCIRAGPACDPTVVGRQLQEAVQGAWELLQAGQECSGTTCFWPRWSKTASRWLQDPMWSLLSQSRVVGARLAQTLAAGAEQLADALQRTARTLCPDCTAGTGGAGGSDARGASSRHYRDTSNHHGRTGKGRAHKGRA